MSYEQDREDNAVGPDDETPCPVCGGNAERPCTCEAEFMPLGPREYECLCPMCDPRLEEPYDFFDDDTPADAAASARLAVAEEESSLEQDRRSSGSFAESQARLARVLNVFTEMALRRHAAAEEK